jgi:hypothetical protein
VTASTPFSRMETLPTAPISYLLTADRRLDSGGGTFRPSPYLNRRGKPASDIDHSRVWGDYRLHAAAVSMAAPGTKGMAPPPGKAAALRLTGRANSVTLP